jgi:hypothetical protein
MAARRAAEGSFRKEKDRTTPPKGALSPTGNPWVCCARGIRRRTDGVDFIRPGHVAFAALNRGAQVGVRLFGYGPLALCLYITRTHPCPGLINPSINREICWAQTATLEPIRVWKTSFSRCGCRFAAAYSRPRLGLVEPAVISTVGLGFRC